MPLNSLMPVLAMPCTLPDVVSTTQKSWPLELPAKPAAGRGGGGACCGAADVCSAAAAGVEPSAEAAIRQDDCLRKPRRVTDGWREVIRDLLRICNCRF